MPRTRTIIVEVSGPVQWRPWRYSGPAMRRAGWLWFAIAVLRVPFETFYEEAHPVRWADE